jgi:hypothetical protein
LFEIGVPSREEWKAMFFLHVLGDDGEFEMLRETLETLLVAGSLTSQKIVECLEHEAQWLKGQMEEKAAQETAYTAHELLAKPKTNQKSKPNSGCSNCGYTNHSVEQCFRPGGPLFRLKQKEQEKSKDKGKDGKHKHKQKEHGKANAAHESSESSSNESTYETAAVFSHQDEAIYLAQARTTLLDMSSLSNFILPSAGTFDYSMLA